jgi:hypothetical protein
MRATRAWDRLNLPPAVGQKDVLPESSQFYIVEHQEFTSLTHAHVILPSLGSQAIACPRASKKLAVRRFARQGVSDGPEIQLEFETFRQVSD